MAESDMGKSPFSGFVLDPGKCSQLSLEKKRELVHEVAKWHNDATRILSSFSRRELLEIICAEMGKERKYTGYTKHQMIEHLLKLITQNIEGEDCDDLPSSSSDKFPSSIKRQKIKDTPLQAHAGNNGSCHGSKNCSIFSSPLGNAREHVKFRVCQNLACKAQLSMDDSFCKRCSCCICHRYDDNKDPSLWLACGSDSPNADDSCGMSCHLLCAFKHEKAGIMCPSSAKLDGSYNCVSCGRINGLMSTWRKQVLYAKGARRLDVLCLRIYLAHTILMGTEKYKEVHTKVESAADLLKSEVGPLDQISRKMTRCIVNRLNCGCEVQGLCASALEAFDSLFSDPNPDDMQEEKFNIKIEESLPNSVIIVLECDDNLLKDVVGCRLWHRKSVEEDYPEKPTIFVLQPEKKFKINDLSSSTEYICKITLSACSGTLGTATTGWITPAASDLSYATVSSENVKDKIPLVAEMDSQMESTNSSEAKICSRDHHVKLKSPKNGHKKKKTVVNSRAASPKFSVDVSPASHCKLQEMREATATRYGRKLDESDYEYSVRVVKWLELHGFIDKNFRVQFLTWFSLRATVSERRVVCVFVDTLIDDPLSLAGQLVHTFKEKINCKK